jgi:hypothetical protein
MVHSGRLDHPMRHLAIFTRAKRARPLEAFQTHWPGHRSSRRQEPPGTVEAAAE